MSVKKKTKKPGPRRIPKNLNTTLYCYVEKGNAEHAKKKGKELFGSFSAYVNALVAKDRGVKPVLGYWQAKGEAKKKREQKEKERDRKFKRKAKKK